MNRYFDKTREADLAVKAREFAAAYLRRLDSGEPSEERFEALKQAARLFVEEEKACKKGKHT